MRRKGAKRHENIRNLREVPKKVCGVCAKHNREHEESARSARESIRAGAKRQRRYEEFARSAKLVKPLASIRFEK